MERFGRFGELLEKFHGDVVVEALALDTKCQGLGEAVLQTWIGEALERTGRGSKRERLLPASMMMWMVILMGVFRRVSYANLLEKIHALWRTLQRWSEAGPPCTPAVSKARDRLGVGPVRLLFELCARAWMKATTRLLVAGRAVYVLDGTNLKTADTPRPNAFEKRSKT